MAMLTAGCVRKTRSAARATCRSSASATNISSCLNSMPSAFVKSALGLGEAGPSPRARIFARCHRTRAPGAAEARIVLIVERVVGNGILADVAPDALGAPVGERIDFPEGEPPVPLELPRARTRRGLVAADAGDPRIQRPQLLRQRLNLANGTEIGRAHV